MAGVEAGEIRSLIQRRRLQLLVHAHIYYRMGDSLVSDKVWDEWAKKLVELQMEHPKIAERVDYHIAFKGFDGSTGFDLPIMDDDIKNKAEQLMRRKTNEKKRN